MGMRLWLVFVLTSALSPGVSRATGASAENEAKKYFLRGGTKFEKGDYEGAIADCTKAIQLNPSYANAYSARGGARGKRGDYNGSLADSNHAIKLNPKDADAYSNRAAVEIIRGKYNASIADANHAIQLSPRLVAAYNNRAASKFGLGDYHGAIADYNRSIHINPKDAEAYKERGVIRELQQDWADALSDYYRTGELSRSQETIDFVHLRNWVIRTRTGQSMVANNELTLYLGKGSKSWSAKAGAFLLGKVSEAEFLSESNSSDPHKNRLLRSETWYYIGIKHLLARESGAAKDCFTKCVAIGPPTLDESLYAQSELRTLGARQDQIATNR